MPNGERLETRPIVFRLALHLFTFIRNFDRFGCFFSLFGQMNPAATAMNESESHTHAQSSARLLFRDTYSDAANVWSICGNVSFFQEKHTVEIFVYFFLMKFSFGKILLLHTVCRAFEDNDVEDINSM